MFRITCYLTCTLIICSLFGCAMCCGPYDDDYNLFGGSYQRVDAAHGRVGSALSDPYYQGGGPSADSNLAPETPRRIPSNSGDGSGGTDETGSNSGEDKTDQEIRDQIEKLRREMELDGKTPELPSPNKSPSPDTSSPETAQGWQNRLRQSRGQWR